MHSTSSTLNKLKQDFPHLTFMKGDVFLWSPKDATIYYSDITDIISLLHELAHASLGHKEYTRDIELLKMERQAWEYTVTTLAPKYNSTVRQEYVEQMIDTYRDWLHNRSLCPSCQANGLQADKNHYECLACSSRWRVNDARTCALRRYKTKK